MRKKIVANMLVVAMVFTTFQYGVNTVGAEETSLVQEETQSEVVSEESEDIDTSNEGIQMFAVTNDIVTTDKLAITGFQMTAYFRGVAGAIGFRIVYQSEPTINGQEIQEVGLVYGLNINGTLTDDDVVVGSSNTYVRSFAATQAGKLDVKMGSSATADYYAMTMSAGSTVAAYTTPYFTRAYAKLNDNSYVYSDIEEYTVFDVADYLYQQNLLSNLNTYNYMYSKVLYFVDNTYKAGEFNWGDIIVKPNVIIKH